MTISEKRITRVRSASWLSLTDLAFHLGYGYSKARALTLLPDFPKPSEPTGGWKEARWNKEEVDLWMGNHKKEAA